MKSKLKLSAVIVLFLAASTNLLPAQFSTITTVGGQTIDPTSGLPVPQVVGAQPVQFDPTTGQPIAQQPAAEEQQWIDPNWGDATQLTNISLDGVPVGEVAKDLRIRFKEEFDVLLPTQSTTEAINPLTGMPLEPTDWISLPIHLQLRNVGAAEVFGAMNLMFENDKIPLRWQLKMNGSRKMAILRVLAAPNPGAYAPRDVQRRVYYVGNLIGEEKNGGMTMEQIIKTVTDVWRMADASGGNIQFHKEAQLLVVTGTTSQIDFMEQTLKALGQKVDQQKVDRPGRTPGSGEPKSATPAR